MYANYNQIRQHIANKTPFEGSSSNAWLDNDGIYHIVSYSTEIAEIDKNNKVLYFNGKHYSRTTSRLQNIIKSIYGGLK